MKAVRRLDLLREVLDHEVVDVEGTSCGMVDDIEFAAGKRGPEVAALLIGPGAWTPRLPALFALGCERLFGRGVVRVPWPEVIEISETIRLRSKADELGLGRLDRKAGRWLARLPKS
jgi:sporulation protein YlmC with PRC-barrel domain